MPLPDASVRSARPDDMPAAKFSDADGMYLFVTASGEWWRLDYRYLGKCETLTLGTYRDVSLSKARTRALDTGMLLADGIDPGDESARRSRPSWSETRRPSNK